MYPTCRSYYKNTTQKSVSQCVSPPLSLSLSIYLLWGMSVNIFEMYNPYLSSNNVLI